MSTVNNSVPFLNQINRFNGYTYPSLQSLAFPILFLFSDRDIIFCNRNLNISLTKSNYHLLKYLICAWANNVYMYLFAKYNY